MVLVVVIIILAVSLFAYGSGWRRVDAPVNPPGRVRIRRRYDYWAQSGQNILRYIVGIVIGVALAWYFHQPHPSGGQSVEVSAPASQSPDRASVVSTMNDYFAGLNTGQTCHYTSAFTESYRPPATLEDCKSTVSSAPEIQHITAGPNGSVDVQVAFVSKTKAEGGQPHDVCTTWASDFRMNREAGQLRIANPPVFRGTPVNC